jgi:hypothetical protein
MNIFDTMHCRKHAWIFHRSLGCEHCIAEGVETKALPMAQDLLLMGRDAQDDPAGAGQSPARGQ